MLGPKRLVFFLLIIAVNLAVCPRLYCEIEWREYNTDHFIIYYPKEVIKDYIKTVADKAEEYYSSIAQNLGFKLSESWSYDRRAKIYIFKDEQTYKKEAAERPWAGGSVSIRKKIIKTYPWSEGFLDRLLPHELGHLMFHDLVGLQNNIPLWLDEGLAISQENADIKRYSIMMRDFLKNHYPIPLEKMNSITPSTLIVPEVVYPQAASIVDFLLDDFKKENFQKFCKYLKSGQGLKRALRGAYGFEDFDELDQAWRKYLNSLEDIKEEIPVATP